MAYSPIEQAYIDGVVSTQFPDPEPVQLADSGQVKSDAGADYGSIGPIKRNKAQEALGYVGELLSKAGVELDKVGLDVPVLGRITLKDLTVGDSGKVLEDMSYGFMPVEGGGNFISGTKRIKPDAALELLNLAPAVGAAAKLGGKAAIKGVQATKGLPVGLSIKEVGQGVDDLGFYSAAAKAVDAIQQPKGTGDQFLKQIEKTPGVKADEIKWTGLDDFLQSKKTVTKQEVQDYIANNRVEIKEVTLGNPLTADEQAEIKALRAKDRMTTSDRARFDVLSSKEDSGSAPKFGKYQLPGGENYREVLLTLPDNRKPPTFEQWLDNYTMMTLDQVNADPRLMEIAQNSYKTDVDKLPKVGGFKSNHFDQPNILAHMRVNDRIDADGKKVLFVEEVQSDWHQAGRKKGYQDPAIKKEYQALEQELMAVNREALPYTSKGEDAPQALIERKVALSERMDALDRKHREGVPDAPFKTTWHELAMKRAIQMAAEGGYDRIAFTTGAQQAARYDLSKQIDLVELIPNTTGNGKPFVLRAFKEGSNQGSLINQAVNESELEDLIGKDLAQKLVDQKPTEYGDRSLAGIDLQVGGEGMKGFYDNIVPKFLDKYSKKWDAKTGMTAINTGEKGGDLFEVVLPNGKVVSSYASKKQAESSAKSFSGAVVRPIDNGEPVHFIEITPKMRESVATQGQPMFAVGAGGAGAAATQTEQKKETRIKYDANGRRVQ